jgi:uncharacterized membrane protein YdbT with pleckstrin-like domain
MSELAPQVTPKPLDLVERDVKAIARPDKNLLWLYMIRAIMTLPLAPIIGIPLFFHYETLRYRFDDDGVHASWGVLLRREVSLTYARIQDIHLRRGILERWLGIGSVQIQTASGAGASDLVIEGVREFTEVRDFLYAKMRGAHSTSSSTPKAAAHVDDAAIALLREIKDDIKAVRESLEAKRA